MRSAYPHAIHRASNIEARARGILNTQGISPMLSHFYMDYCRLLDRLIHSGISDDALVSAATGLAQSWLPRGLSTPVLKILAKTLFNITPQLIETVNVNPSTLGNLNDWAPVGAASKVTCVLPPDNENTNYIRTGGAGRVQSFFFTPPTLPPGSVISSVAVSGRSRTESGSPTARLLLRIQPTNSFSTSWTQTTSFVTKVLTISRPGGGPWTIPDLSILQIGIGTFTGANTQRCTTLFGIISYI